MYEPREYQALTDLNGNIADLACAVRDSKASGGEEVVAFGRKNAIAVLEKFVAGHVSADEISEWAELIHGLDGIGIEKGFEDIVLKFLFEVSTPEICGRVSVELARRWIARLRECGQAAEGECKFDIGWL
ncbi:hypothetical protein NE236_15785 [Actinoallomurus purpureus]|uniref:hypothetical protein n=1 Tax=Actinoallomurus purpureus TaxID=478114 RepID=UPI002092844B|nr:hypothetical protein [Actinoallomurus purpureus]MCO6006446.1 hypothetical protein [Actinoallomurus purpureus]